MVWALALAGLGGVAAVALRSYAALCEEVRASTRLMDRFRNETRLPAFTIADPYACPGLYRRAQLHLHTSNSPDIPDKVPVEETIRRYREDGYSFVVVTDHDRVTDASHLSTPDFVVVPGEEKTLPVFLWPLGKHLLRLGVAPGLEEVRAPAHPNWDGNLGTGRWRLADLLALDDYQLLEVLNGKSNSTLDFWLWHQVLAKRGYQNPVWAIAVDDTDNAVFMGTGWVMVKTTEVSAPALLDALRHGHFYATSGPTADFRVEDGVIRASTRDGAWVRFINARNEVVAATRGEHGEYRPVGDEGFVRVEVVSQDGHPAWSQPFFLIPESDARAVKGR